MLRKILTSFRSRGNGLHVPQGGTQGDPYGDTPGGNHGASVGEPVVEALGEWKIAFPDPEPLPVVINAPNSGETVTTWPAGGQRAVREPTARELAEKFLSWTQRQPPFVGNWLSSDLVRAYYRCFCEALGWPEQPYEKFAHELSRLTRRRRREKTRLGERTRYSEYLIPDPGLKDRRREGA